MSVGNNVPEESRVFAVSHQEGGKTYLFGFGVYEGLDFLPEDIFPGATAHRKAAMDSLGVDSNNLSSDQKNMLIKLLGNPKIRLDDGRVVWGAECWWGPEAEFSKRVTPESVVNVDIDQHREKAKHNREANSKMMEFLKEEITGAGDGSRTLVVNQTWN